MLSINASTGNTKITYNRLNNSTAYTKNTNYNYPIRDLTGSSHIVTQTKTSNGIGGYNTTNYSYGGLKANLHGRGSLGFSSITTTQQQSGKTSISEYNQDFPLTGTIKNIPKPSMEKPSTMPNTTTATLMATTAQSNKSTSPKKQKKAMN